MFGRRKQLERIERHLTALRVLAEELLRRPVNEPEKIIASASLCFKQGVEAAKVESMQCAQPTFLNPEARANFRQAAEAQGLAEAQKALHDPNNAGWLNNDDLTRQD